MIYIYIISVTIEQANNHLFLYHLGNQTGTTCDCSFVHFPAIQRPTANVLNKWWSLLRCCLEKI